MARKNTKLKPVEKAFTKIRLGYGNEDGFQKMKISELNEIPDESVETLFVVGIFHQLTQEARFQFMNLSYKLLKSKGQIMIVTPYWNTRRYISDPLAKWPPLCEESFYVYSKEWREKEAGEILSLPLTCDFTHKAPNGMLVIPAGHESEPDVAVRNEEFRSFASRFYNNAIMNLHVNLTKS